jgi:hypothetical protein
VFLTCITTNRALRLFAALPEKRREKEATPTHSRAPPNHDDAALSIIRKRRYIKGKIALSSPAQVSEP